MRAPLTASEQDLRTLAGIVSDERSDLPAQGLPLSLLSELKEQIPCDFLLCEGYDTTLQRYWFTQQVPEDDEREDSDEGDFDRVLWEHYWDCLFCSYPDRTKDLRSIVKVSDFYSVRQWHSTGMYRDLARPQGFENYAQLCLSEPPGPDAGPGRTVRLYFLREPGPDFS